MSDWTDDLARRVGAKARNRSQRGRLVKHTIKLAGDLRWNSGDEEFGWIALDNSVAPMDAPTVIAFGKAVAAFKQACIFYARGLKDQIDVAENPAAIDIEAGWPS